MLPAIKQQWLAWRMRRMAAQGPSGRSLPASPASIVLWQFGGVGDMLLGTPVIEALHRAFPEAAIHLWCSHPPLADVLHRFPGVASIDAFHVYDFDARTLLRDDVRQRFRGIGENMAAQRPELLINLHVPALIDWWFAEWLMISRLSPSYALGYDPRFLHGRSLFDTSLNAAERDGIHYTRLYCRLLEAAGIACQEATRFPLSGAERSASDALLAGCGVSGKRWVSMHIGASRLKMEGKMWPVERFAELAARLLDAGVLPVLIGVQAEAEMAAQVLAAAPGAHSLVGRTSIGEMAAMIARADAHVGHDSGPFHVAAAVGTPCVTICGRPDAEPEYLAYDRPDIAVLTAPSPLQISVDDVLERVLEVSRHG